MSRQSLCGNKGTTRERRVNSSCYSPSTCPPSPSNLLFRSSSRSHWTLSLSGIDRLTHDQNHLRASARVPGDASLELLSSCGGALGAPWTPWACVPAAACRGVHAPRAEAWAVRGPCQRCGSGDGGSQGACVWVYATFAHSTCRGAACVTRSKRAAPRSVHCLRQLLRLPLPQRLHLASVPQESDCGTYAPHVTRSWSWRGCGHYHCRGHYHCHHHPHPRRHCETRAGYGAAGPQCRCAHHGGHSALLLLEAAARLLLRTRPGRALD